MGKVNLFGKIAEIKIGKKVFKSPPFTIRFELSQKLKSFTKITAELFNPNDKTIALCEHRIVGKETIYTPIEIKAGYKDNIGIAGQGVIKEFNVNRDGTNRILELIIQDNDKWFDKKLNKSFTNTKASVILNDIAGDRPHSINVGNDKLYKGNYVVKDIFSTVVKIADDTDSYYFFRNGTLIMEPKGFIPERAFKIGYGTGLVSVPERIDEPRKKGKKKKAFHGFRIKTLFIYGLHLFRAVDIDTPTTKFTGFVTDSNIKFSSFEKTVSTYKIAKEL